MSNSTSRNIRVVRRPDRRQDEDRRAQPRGGRRASDQPASAQSSAGAVDDLWASTIDRGVRKIRPTIYVH